jgi:membrane-associated protein
MTYWRFLAYNIVGGLLWVGLLMTAGFWFGGLNWVKDHFVVVELAIIAISLLPMAVEYVRYRRDRRRTAPEPVMEEKHP